MPDISSHFSDNYRLTSGGHLPRVGFPCFLELTGNLTKFFLFLIAGLINVQAVLGFWMLIEDGIFLTFPFFAAVSPKKRNAMLDIFCIVQ